MFPTIPDVHQWEKPTLLAAMLCTTANDMAEMTRWVMYGRRPRCKRESDFSAKHSGCGHVYGLFSPGGFASIAILQPLWPAGPDVIR